MADTNPELTKLVIAEREAGLTMSAISEKMNALGYCTTKNSVIGIINRRAKHLVGEPNSKYTVSYYAKDDAAIQPPRTLWDRMQALHDRMDAVLAECRSVPRLAASHEL